FNTIITSLKALDECYSSKNYVRKFLRALHPKWRAKVTAIEESKDLTSLSLDELIGNLKVHEMIIKKDSVIVKAKGERTFLALKAKKESSKENVQLPEVKTKSTPWRLETSRSSSREKMWGSKSSYRRMSEPPKEKNQRAFVGGSWSDSGKEDDEKDKDETCLMAQASSDPRSLEDWEVSSLQCMQRRFTRREKDCFMPKGIKQSPLEKVLLKSVEKYIRFSLKDCTWCCSSELRYIEDKFLRSKSNIMLPKSKLLLSSENKPEPRKTKDFEAKYHKVKAKLSLLSSSASTPSSSSGKNKGLIAETYDWDDEEVSSDENEVTEVKALMALLKERVFCWQRKCQKW
ncbi:hypothetical protein Tco_0995961, partial [Tanacetum coccineum]